MSTVQQLTYIGAAIVDSNDRLYHTDYHKSYSESGTTIFGKSGRYYLLVLFPEIPSAIKYKKLLNVKVEVTVSKLAASTMSISTLPLSGNFDPDTVTWDTAPGLSYLLKDRWGYYSMASSWQNEFRTVDLPSSYYDNGTAYTDAINISRISKRALSSNSVAIVPYGDTTFSFEGSFKLLVEVDANTTVTSQIEAVNSPTSGWVNPATAQTFSWDYTYSGDYPCPGNFVQSSATFYWRSGTSGSFTSVAASGQSITIPANTFPGGTIQWYVRGTDTQGTSSQTSVYTITTTDSEAIATAIEPNGTVEDGSAAIVFKWSVSNDTGSTPTGANLQYSTDGESWSTLADISGADTQYTAPANTFSAGSVYWRVRALNRDGVAGSWSESKQFVSVAAPPSPSVQTDAKPYATISWQSDGQQAYKVTIDGTVFGPYFGTKKTFTVADFLTDGNHSASVEVQGLYGLWSAPGTVTFTVTNVPGDSVTLAGSFERDGVLSWTTASTTADFYIYRDEARIGHTSGTDFTDRFALGSHGYFVVNKLANGYYTKSNSVAGKMYSCVTAISLLSGGEWLELTLSENSDSVQSFDYSRTVSIRHVLGAELPVIEMSPFRDGTATYDTSFLDLDKAKEFERLSGELVVVKSRGGNVVVGYLSSMSKRMADFYIAFDFTVKRIHWGDYVDES